MNISKIIQALIGRIPFLSRQRCNICEKRVGRFIPYSGTKQNTPTLAKTLDVIGSDTTNFECPWCGAHDRERHLLMYIRAVGLFDSLPEMSVLHFAPERQLSKLIAAKHPLRYVKCDLFPNSADVEEVDILSTPYADKSFDLVIANHVLEHVTDDMDALSEIYRIMKPGAYAILQTPFSPKLHTTWSDDGVATDQARLVAYGQEDHVRLYGRDIFDRFLEKGLTTQIYLHKEILSQYDPKQYGVNVNEPFFLFNRAKNKETTEML